MAKRNKMKDFLISEISAVDNPAQEHARAILIKRRNPEMAEKKFSKKHVCTSIAKAYIDPVDGAKSFVEAVAVELKLQDFREQMDKFCPYLYALDCSLRSIVGDSSIDKESKLSMARNAVEDFMSILREKWTEMGADDMDMNEFMMSALEKAQTSEENDDMSELEKLKKKNAELEEKLKKATEENGNSEEVTKLQGQVEELNKKIEELTKAKETAEAEASMNGEQKAHYDKLKGEAKEAFLKMEPSERHEEVKKARDGDESITVNGHTVRKSECSESQFAILKAQQEQIDKQQEAFEKAENARIETELAKRADEEFQHLPGETAEKVKVLKAIRSLDEDVQKSLESMLTAGEKATSLAFEKFGHGDGSTRNGKAKEFDFGKSDDNGDTFMKHVKEIAKREGIKESEAMAKAREEYPDEFEAWRFVEA